MPTVVAVKQNLILQASSYSQKFYLGIRVWVPIPVYRYQNSPGYVADKSLVLTFLTDYFVKKKRKKKLPPMTLEF